MGICLWWFTTQDLKSYISAKLPTQHRHKDKNLIVGALKPKCLEEPPLKKGPKDYFGRGLIQAVSTC